MIICTNQRQLKKKQPSGSHKFVKKHLVSGGWRVAAENESHTAIVDDNADADHARDFPGMGTAMIYNTIEVGSHGLDFVLFKQAPENRATGTSFNISSESSKMSNTSA
jgi:hypothetical protein